MSLKRVKEFMDENQTCVISSIRDGRPQSATVGVSLDDNFNILIATKRSTRKAENIVNNPQVSIVVGFSGSKTVQIEGIAEVFDSENNSDRVEYHFKKVPGAKKHAKDDGQIYFLIKPSWLRYTDYTLDDPIFETEVF